MFPTPEKVDTPGISAPNAKLEETAQHLLARLQDGVDCEDEVMGYYVSGGRPDGRLLFASLGNRLAEKKPCPKSLTVLLAVGADAKVVHPQIGPAITWAARNGNVEIVKRLVDAGADMEALDPDKSPALNSAIVAGAGAVAIELIRMGANVMWTHHDGATFLHVITSWLCDGHAAGMNRRMPPVGDEPAKLVDMLIYHGIDPTAKQKWEGKGLSAVDTWRARKDSSPWLEDERTWKDFPTAAKAIHKTLTTTADAMEQKDAGNKYFKAKEYDRAIQAYAGAREKLDKAGMVGHHMAALWCNEANCCHQMGNIEGARAACEEGLKLFAQEKILTKLKFHLEKCDKPTESSPEDAEKKAPAKEAEEEPKLRPKAPRSNMNKGFLQDGKADLGYGAEGSHNGMMPQFYQQPINGGEAVINVPINRPDCAKINLIDCGDIMQKKDSDDEDEQAEPKEIDDAALARQMGLDLPEAKS